MFKVQGQRHHRWLMSRYSLEVTSWTMGSIRPCIIQAAFQQLETRSIGSLHCSPPQSLAHYTSMQLHHPVERNGRREFSRNTLLTSFEPSKNLAYASGSVLHAHMSCGTPINANVLCCTCDAMPDREMRLGSFVMGKGPKHLSLVLTYASCVDAPVSHERGGEDDRERTHLHKGVLCKFMRA